MERSHNFRKGVLSATLFGLVAALWSFNSSKWRIPTDFQLGRIRKGWEPPRVPGLRRCTFLYMGMASKRPSENMKKRACFPDSMLLFLAFREPLKNVELQPHCRFKAIFGLNTTWTTGRNMLRDEAFKVEAQQGWKFEYFIFMDDDVQLIQNPLTDKSKIYRGDAGPEEQLRLLLMRDRPLRGSVQYGVLPIGYYKNTKESCIVTCFMDAMVDAFHRTAVEGVLPYDGRLDGISWWMSAYMMNLKFAAVLPQYCSFYAQLSVDVNASEHSDYPRQAPETMIWRTARNMVLYELSQAQAPGFPWGMSHDEFYWATYATMRGMRGQQRSCISNRSGVDYSQTVSAFSNLFHRRP